MRPVNDDKRARIVREWERTPRPTVETLRERFGVSAPTIRRVVGIDASKGGEKR